MADPTKSTTTTTLPAAAAKGPSARSSLSDEEMRVRLNAARAGAKTEAAEERKGNRLVEAFKTFLWVAPLTALIWIYAEREQVAVLNDVPVTLQARSRVTDRVVTIVSPDDHRAYVNLQGPRSSVETIRDRLADPRNAVVLDIPEEIAPGTEREVPITDAIKQSDVVRGLGADVLRARPAVRVRVEQKLTRRVPVRADPSSKIVGDVTFEPDAVAVEGPASVFAAIPSDQLYATADLSRFASRTRGNYDEEVPLYFPYRGDNVTLPKTVKVKVNVKESSVEVTLPSIPVVVQLPALVLDRDRYKVSVSARDMTLPNVRVTGPPEAIDAIQKNRSSPAPAAILDVTPEDLQSPGEKTKRLTAAGYRMPKDVTVLEPEREITFTVVDRGN